MLDSTIVDNGITDANITDITELNLEDLLTQESTAASLRPLTIRETPGIITIIDRKQIIESGARDLTDLLRRVPGFDVELDAHNVTSLAFRGVWGQEGKILLLVDGQELNEILYGTIQIENRVPLASIAQIEIVRGPGSVIYGGHAELASSRLRR